MDFIGPLKKWFGGGQKDQKALEVARRGYVEFAGATSFFGRIVRHRIDEANRIAEEPHRMDNGLIASVRLIRHDDEEWVCASIWVNHLVEGALVRKSGSRLREVIGSIDRSMQRFQDHPVLGPELNEKTLLLMRKIEEERNLCPF